MSLKKLTNKSAKVKGENPKRDYNPKPDNIGRDGQMRIIEKYGNDAIASFRNNAAGVVEFFESQKPGSRMLNDPVRKNAKAAYEQAAVEAGHRRLAMAREYRDIKEDAASDLAAMRSPDWEYIGAPGFRSKEPTDRAIRARKIVVNIERVIPKHVQNRLEQCLIREEYQFDVPNKKQRESILDELRQGLDIVAVELNQMTFVEFRERWPALSIYGRERKSSDDG